MPVSLEAEVQLYTGYVTELGLLSGVTDIVAKLTDDTLVPPPVPVEIAWTVDFDRKCGAEADDVAEPDTAPTDSVEAPSETLHGVDMGYPVVGRGAVPELDHEDTGVPGALPVGLADDVALEIGKGGVGDVAGEATEVTLPPISEALDTAEPPRDEGNPLEKPDEKGMVPVADTDKVVELESGYGAELDTGATLGVVAPVPELKPVGPVAVDLLEIGYGGVGELRPGADDDRDPETAATELTVMPLLTDTAGVEELPADEIVMFGSGRAVVDEATRVECDVAAGLTVEIVKFEKG